MKIKLIELFKPGFTEALAELKGEKISLMDAIKLDTLESEINKYLGLARDNLTKRLEEAVIRDATGNILRDSNGKPVFDLAKKKEITIEIEHDMLEAEVDLPDVDVKVANLSTNSYTLLKSIITFKEKS